MRWPSLLTTEVDYVIRSGATAFPGKPVYVRTGPRAPAPGPVTGSVRRLWAA
ncbi:hypothetical protein [Herbidospora cretacea]|uniref:hypothetical protein n=1 Tax=Herbidospora cretacea TaxID=28444 RepID=UPI000A78BF5E|nr:hypothetical protein [Herbidospora cretacea]